MRCIAPPLHTHSQAWQPSRAHSRHILRPRADAGPVPTGSAARRAEQSCGLARRAARALAALRAHQRGRGAHDGGRRAGAPRQLPRRHRRHRALRGGARARNVPHAAAAAAHVPRPLGRRAAARVHARARARHRRTRRHAARTLARRQRHPQRRRRAPRALPQHPVRAAFPRPLALWHHARRSVGPRAGHCAVPLASARAPRAQPPRRRRPRVVGRAPRRDRPAARPRRAAVCIPGPPRLCGARARRGVSHEAACAVPTPPRRLGLRAVPHLRPRALAAAPQARQPPLARGERQRDAVRPQQAQAVGADGAAGAARCRAAARGRPHARRGRWRTRHGLVELHTAAVRARGAGPRGL